MSTSTPSACFRRASPSIAYVLPDARRRAEEDLEAATAGRSSSARTRSSSASGSGRPSWLIASLSRSGGPDRTAGRASRFSIRTFTTARPGSRGSAARPRPPRATAPPRRFDRARPRRAAPARAPPPGSRCGSRPLAGGGHELVRHGRRRLRVLRAEPLHVGRDAVAQLLRRRARGSSPTRRRRRSRCRRPRGVAGSRRRPRTAGRSARSRSRRPIRPGRGCRWPRAGTRTWATPVTASG